MNVVETARDGDTKCDVGAPPYLFYHDVVGISSRIPESFDFGTVSVELTCIASSSAYIILGSGCGTLFVYNRKLEKFARPLRTDSFEAVTCIHHVHLLDDFVAVGHNTGTLIVMRLPSGREGANTSLTQCIDSDSHRHSSITAVEWNSDATQVVSGDCYGTIILSTVMFNTGEFYHTFLFEGQSPVSALGFFGNSVIVYNGLQMVLVDSKHSHISRVICDTADRGAVLSVRCTKSFVCVVEESCICTYPISFLKCETVSATEMVGYSVSFRSVEWNESSSKLAILTCTSVFVMFSYASREVLWKAPLNGSPGHIIGKFCVDLDDSVLYITKPRGLHRVGVSPIAESLLDKETDSPLLALLSSPRKLIFTGAHRVTQKGVMLLSSAINTAKDITVNSAGIKEDVGSFVQNVECKDGCVEVPFDDKPVSNCVGGNQNASFGELCSSLSEENPADYFVQRKEKVRRRKATYSGEENLSECSLDDSVTFNENSILTLREQVLGRTVASNTLCESVIGINSTSASIPAGGSHTSDTYFKPDEKEPSSPVSSRTSSAAECRPLKNEEKPDVLSSLNEVEGPTNSPCQSDKNDLDAESVTVAYEYLLQHNTCKPSCLDGDINCVNRFGSIQSVKGAVDEHSHKEVFSNDCIDIWLKVYLPYTAKAFAVGSKHLLLCHKKKSARIIVLDELGFKKPNWQVTKWSAENVAVNDEESIIWKVRHHIGWSAIDPLSISTRFEECATDGGGVIEVSVGRNVAWYLTKEGVSLQMELPDKAIFSNVDRDWPMKSISVSDAAIWAIRSDTGSLVVRVGLARCKMGLDWVEIVPEGPSKLVSVCVFHTYGFALDDNGELWFSTGLDHHHPYGVSDLFYKICAPVIDTRAAPIETWTIRASTAGLFLCAGKVMFFSRNAVSGHKFLPEVPKKLATLDNFSLISASSFQGGDGPLHLCRQNSEIFVYRPMRRSFITINMPQGSSAIVSLSGAGGKLSIINTSGRVFHFDGELSLWEEETHLSGPVCSLSHGKLGSWAVGCDGAILCKPNGANFWKLISPPPDLDITPMQVFSSPNGSYVWLLAGGRGWARANISDRNPSGVKWIETYHPSGFSSFAVGNTVVWALDSSNILLRLQGLAAGNPAGNYWRPVSFQTFRAISVDAQSELWAIDIDNRLVRHISAVYLPEQLKIYDSVEPFEVI